MPLISDSTTDGGARFSARGCAHARNAKKAPGGGRTSRQWRPMRPPRGLVRVSCHPSRRLRDCRPARATASDMKAQLPMLTLMHDARALELFEACALITNEDHQHRELISVRHTATTPNHDTRRRTPRRTCGSHVRTRARGRSHRHITAFTLTCTSAGSGMTGRPSVPRRLA